MSLVAVTGLAVVEGYFLQRTVFVDSTFRNVCLSALGVNLSLWIIWNVFIWPFFFNPLRHLPEVKVRSPVEYIKASDTDLVKGRFNHARILFDSPRGRRPLQWMKTIPNNGLLHIRDTINRSFLIATNHQALLDIMSTNTYDFEKPWRTREFLARIIGFGLILSEGAAHKKQRKALTPAFNIKNVRALYRLMWEKTGELLEELEAEIRQHPMEGTGPEEGVGKVEMSVWAR